MRARLERALASRRARRRLRHRARAGVPKGQKMDFVVEKATELGVRRDRAVRERANRRRRRAREGKVERWRRLARSRGAAVRAHGRAGGRRRRSAWAGLARAVRAALRRRAGPVGAGRCRPLRERLPALLAGARAVAGRDRSGRRPFAHAEVAQARAGGRRPISLGSANLRTETAGLVACSAVLYASGEL